MGALMFYYFMKWVETPAPLGGGGGPTWVNDHVAACINIGPPYLGVPKAVAALLSGEMRDMAELRAMAVEYQYIVVVGVRSVGLSSRSHSPVEVVAAGILKVKVVAATVLRGQGRSCYSTRKAKSTDFRKVPEVAFRSGLTFRQRQVGKWWSQPQYVGSATADIHSLDDALAQVHSRLRQLEQRPVAAPDVTPSNTSDRLEALEIDVRSLKDGVQLQQTATQQLEQRICTAATHSSFEPRETTPRFNDHEIFRDSTKTDPIPWFCKFALKLQLHHVSEHKHYPYLYSRSGGACQAWLDNLLSKHGVVAADLHTKISRDDLKAAWHKRFQVEPPEIKAMDKLMTFEQGTLPNVDWIVEYQRLTSVLLTDYLRCLPAEVRTKMVDEANVEQHSFVTFSKKALDIEAKLGSAHQASHDGRKKLPQDWKKKGQLMFVDHYGQTTEIDDFPDLGDVTEQDGASETSDGGVVAPIKEKARGTRKKKVVRSMGQGDQGTTAWVKLGLEYEVWRDRVARGTCMNCGNYGHTSQTCVVEREVVHAIEVVPGSKVPRGRIYRMSPAELDELRRQLKELTEKGWIRPSTSPYDAPVLFVPKKGGTLRMRIDYRGLNAITVKNAEPIPRIDDLLDRVQGCRYFTKIDLKSGYHQIAIRPEDQHKTAFRTRYGLYEFVVMPVGLCNAPSTFQHAMNMIFHSYLDKFIVVYLDDILIFSRTVEEHAEHLKTVLGLLRQHQYKVNLEKCEFGRTKILYLGHEISADGLRPDDAKVASIRDWSRPQTVTEVRSFLGTTGYYCPFVKNYSTIASPLTDPTRLDTPWEWTEECEAAFRKLECALTYYEVLKLPDPDKPFVVTTDASQYGIGALAQKEGPKLRPILST
ncbi:hypothetical protein CBR_g32524 [Chara braunii]|uniref:CCHC-type domain-containing protein n=1 Tax=Chara braunii TaxID=69332 RepID=A0A388LH07_CHABU|nr:hypothetical protein CBR_g32524 [Chara braunii]|eukprot:GBG81535.1 hypothetical protein CBR_g32524 [Chara braunii]